MAYNKAVKRYLRRVRRERGRRKRQAAAGLFLACFFYLSAAGLLKSEVISVTDKGNIEYRSPFSGEETESFRIIFRIKTGEIIFVHEKETPENQY